ncbi:unnamed protein product [Urochloa decumbens]|uniref:glutathione transferase n=1 Tax=Urochloa decumbens TaxID=240449 RepID=A0ABC9FW15_9POAL
MSNSNEGNHANAPISLVTYVHGSMVGLGTGAPIVQVYHEKSIILPDVSRVLACLYEKDIKFETHTASYKSLLRLQASSHAPVPFYDGPTFLEESRGICRYIAEKYEHQGYPFLLGKDALERASVEQWLHNEEHAFNPPSQALYCHLAFPLDEEDSDDIDLHTRKLEEVLEVYEQRLSDSRFLAGNKFTLADLVHLPNSHYITSSDKFVYLYDSRKNVSRWWEEISTRKSWQQVLRDMKRVEEQNKQEELKKQQQRRMQKEHPRTSGHPIRIYSRKQTSTEPRTILVPPADTVSPSSLVPPLPTDTSPDEALVSSSQSTPTADKSSAVLSKETVFNAPDKIPPPSVQSTPTTSIEYPIPGQSIKDDSSPTTAKKPPLTDAAMSSTKDASIPEPTAGDLHTRYGPSSSVSNNLDVFDYHPSHAGTDDETPYIKPTTRRTSETFDAFSGSNIAAGHTKTSSIPAKEEPDQSSVSDFYKSDSRAAGIDSRYKESIPYSGRTTRKLEPTDTSASKPHTSDDYHRLQAEQWHTASTGLHDLKQEADYLTSTQQGKPSKDVKQYPSQDSEQATSHPVPEEPMSKELVQRQEYTTRRPYTDQRSRGIVDDKASSDQRSALLLPSTQEHDATPSMQEAAKDARSRIPSQAWYPGGQDTNKQPRDPPSVPRQRAAQDARGTLDESKAADSTVSSESSPDASRASLPRKDLYGARHTTAPFQKRYPATGDTSKQARDKISTPWQMTDKDAEDTTEETKFSDSSSSQEQPLYIQRADAPPWKQGTTEDHHGATSAIQEKHANVKDTTGISRDVAFKPKKMIGQNDQDTFKETKFGSPSSLRDQQTDTWQAASTLPEQEVNQDDLSAAPPYQTRYPSSTTPSNTRYQIAKDASKQPRGTAPTPKKKSAQDDSATYEESNTADEVASTEQPLSARRAPVSPQRQEAQKRYPDDEDDIQAANTASSSWQIAPDNGKDISEETKLADSTTSTKPLYRQQAAPPLPRQVEVEDAQSKVRQRRVTIPEPQKMVPRVAQDTHGERKTAAPGEQFSDRLQAIPQSRPAAAKDAQSATGETIQFPGIFDTTNKTRDAFEETKDPDSTLPLLSKEPTSKVQPSLQEAASHGGLSSKPSTIEQWQRASVPLNGDEIGMATIDQKLTPMSQQATPSAEGVNQMARESGEKRVELHVPTEAEISGVQSASPSFPGASTAHHATTDDKFVKKSTVDERIGEPTKMQTPTPDSARAHTKRPTPMGHEIGGSELVSIPDGQISEAAKTRRDQAPLQEDVQDVNLPTHDVAKDTFKETKIADSTPSSAKPMYTQRSPPTPRHAEVEDTSDKGTKSREIVPDRQKMVERRAGTAGEQLSDSLKATHPSRQAPAEDALSATGDTIQSSDILDTSKKARGTYEEAKGPGSMLSKAQSLGAQDAQHTTGESTTPTAGQRKDVSTKPQPDVQDGPNESKLSVADWHGLGTSEGKDAIETETTITGKKPFSMERIRETSKKSESTTPKAHPTDSQGSVEEKTSSIYQKKPLVAQDSLEQAQTIPVGEKADGYTPKHQRASDDPNTFAEKLNASEPVRAKTHADFSTEEPYREGREDTTDDQKMAPPLLSRELTSQVQPPSEPSHDAAFHGDLSTKPSTIDQWRRASAPLHDVTTSSGDDEVAMSTVDQKPTPMRLEESDEQRVEPPVPIEAETSGFQRASPSFPGASMDDHATIGDKLAKQSIIDERVGKPIQMKTSTPDAKQSIIDERVGKPIQMQASTPDAHPASEPTKRSTPEGHGIGDSDGQISEATKARDDPATVHEDVYGVNLPTRDAGKDTFKETKVADSTPSSAKPMYIQQPANTPLRQTQVGEPRDKSMQSRETIPEQQKMMERKAGISGEQSSDRQKAIRPSRQVAADEDAPTGDTIQSPYIPDGSKKPRGTFEEAIGPGSTLPKAQALDAQDSQLTKGESTMPNADQRKDWKDAKDETIMTEEKSFSTERVREMFQESESTTPKTQSTDSQDYGTVDKPFPVYQKGPLAAQIIQAGEKVDSSTPEHLESSGSPYTYDDKLSASAPARADIHDDRTAEEPYKTYTSDDQKVAPSLSSEEPESQMQPLSEPFQRAVPDGDSPSKSFTIDQWQRASAPLRGVSTDSAPKQMQEPITAAHPASASINGTTTPDGHEAGDLKLDRTTEGQRLKAAKATQDPAIIHEDVHDASLSTRDAAINEKAATHHASGDQPITGYIHDRQAWSPAPTQAQPTVVTPHDPDSSQYAHTAEQKSAPLDKGSTYAVQPLSPVEPIKTDSNVSAADYSNAPQMIFRQQARPSAPSTIGIPASDTQGVIGKIQEVTPDNSRTDDLGKPFVPRATVSPTSDTQLASDEPRSKEVGDLAPSTQIDSTEPRIGDSIAAAPDQAKDSQTTPEPSTYTQRPSGTLQEDEHADNSGEVKSSKPPSVVREGKPAAAVPASAPDTQHGAAEPKFALSGQSSARTTFLAPTPGTQHGTELPKADVDEQKFASSGQEPSLSTEPTKEDTDVAATDQTSTLEKIIDQNYTTPAPYEAKTPFSGTPDASRETQKSTDGDHIDEKPPGQGRVSSYRHVSEPPKGPTPEAHSDVDKETTLGSSQAETLNTRPDPTPIGGDAHLSSDDVPATSSSPETQDLQGSAYARNVPADSLGKIESPGHLPTDQAMAPIMSPSVPSVTPLGTIPGTNSVQPPRQASIASTVDLESVRDTQHGIPEGEAIPAEQKFSISDQEPHHTLEPLSSAESRKEEANAAAGDQPNVPQVPGKTVRNEVKAPSSDAREALQKNQQPSHAVLPEQTTYAVLPEVDSSVVDKETTLLSSQAQTSAAEPDSTPTSGDVSPTSSLQNQDMQPPVTTQAPTTQSLQGSAPTQDDYLRKFEPQKQASTDQVTEPVTSSTAPSDAPQGQDSAQSIQPPLSTEPTEDNTVVTASNQTKDMETITHQQAITPAPDTANTTFLQTDQEAMPPIAGPTSMDPQLAGTLPAEVTHSEQKPSPSEQVSHVSQAIPGKEEMASPPGATVYPTSATQFASAEVQEVSPDDQQAVESSTPLFSSGKQGSLVGSTFVPGEVGPVEKKFAPSDQGLPHSAEQPTSGKPRKEQTGVPTAEQIKEQPTIIGQQDTLDPREVLTSEDVLDTTPTHGDVHLTGSIEPERRSLSVQGEEPKSATQAPPPLVAKDSQDPEDISTNAMGNVQSLKPSTTPDARGITPGSTPRNAAVTEQISSPSGKDSADHVEPAFSLGPRNEGIRDSAPSALLISSTDPSREDSIVAVPDQAKDSQTTPSQQGILSTQRPSGKVQENIPGDNSGKDKSLRPSAVREGIPASTQLNSTTEPRSKEIGDLVPSTQLNSTTEPRNGDAIIAAPDQAEDSQTTPGQQVRLSAPSSYTQHPSGTPQEDEPVDNSGKVNPSKLPSVSAQDQVAVDEEKVVPSGNEFVHNLEYLLMVHILISCHFTVPAPATQYGTELQKTDVNGHKVSPLVQDSVGSVQPSFSSEPTKEDSVVAATDQTSTLENIIDQNDTTPAPDKAKTPFLGNPDASRETQKSTDDDHTDEKLPGQSRVSPYSHVSESPEGSIPESHSDVVYKETTLGSSQAETSKSGPDSTIIGGDAHLSSGDVAASSSLPETQDLQGSAYAQNVPTDSLGKSESPGHLSTDQAMEPRMSPSSPSVAPLGTVTGTNSFQLPKQASLVSTGDLESVGDTQHGIPRGKGTPVEQKFAISDQESAHTTEPPSSAEPSKEEAHVAAGDRPNVPQGPETTVQHQVKASSPDARGSLQKDQQPSHLLSQFSNIVSLLNTLSSDSKLFIQIISLRLNAIALYSASAVDRATTSCFLLLHDTRLPPTKTQYPEVDLLSSILLAQSASQYPSTSKCCVFHILAALRMDSTILAMDGDIDAISHPTTVEFVVCHTLHSVLSLSTGSTQLSCSFTSFGISSNLRSDAPTPVLGLSPVPSPICINSMNILLISFLISLLVNESSPLPLLDFPVDAFAASSSAFLLASSSSGLIFFTGTYPQISAQHSNSKPLPPHLDMAVQQTSQVAVDLHLMCLSYQTTPAVRGGKRGGPDDSYCRRRRPACSTHTRGCETRALEERTSRGWVCGAREGEEGGGLETAAAAAATGSGTTAAAKRSLHTFINTHTYIPTDDHISNPANQLVSEEKASHAGRASEGPISEVSGAVDKKMTLPSSQVQTASTRPESTPMSGGTHISSVDVPATSSLQNEEVDTPAATRVPTPQAPLDSAATQNIPADSLGEIIPAALSDAPQGTESDQLSHASEPLFSAEPSNKASHAGRSSESREGITPEMRSPVVDAKTILPSRQVRTAKTGPDSTPVNGDVPDRSPLQNQEAQPSAATQVPTVQAEGSASTNNEPVDSLGDIKSPRQLPTDEVVAPTTSFAAPSDSSQGTEPGTNSVQPSEQSSFDFKSDEKPTVTQGDQAKTVPHGDLPTSQVVGQSESADYKGMDSQKNLKGASTDENPKMQQQIEQFNTGPFEDSNKEADGTVSDEPENQQQTDHTIVQSLEGNGNQAEQTKAHDTETGGPEDMEASENTNQKNNRISQEETSDHSRKEASGVQRSGENTKDAPNSTEDAPGDVQAISKSKESSRFSEESKAQLQSEDKTSEPEAQNSKTGQPRGDIPANSSQNNSIQSQVEASDKSDPGIQNKDRDSSRLDDSADPTKLGDVED